MKEKLSKEVIEKEVVRENCPAYISTKVDGLDFIKLFRIVVCIASSICRLFSII